MSNTKVACAQIDCEIGNTEANLKKITGQIHTAADAGAEIVILPEAAITGYCFESLEEAAQFAEPLDGPSSQAIAAACHETGAYAIVGFIEKDGDKYYNAAMVVGPDGIVGNYRKIHLPFLGMDRFLTRGNRPFEVIDLPAGKIGVNICYDVSFPESIRCLKLMGAELIVLPTNWPPGARRTADYVVNARAMENHINFAATNRTGIERGWQFIGNSMIVDYNGDTIVKASGESEEIIYAEIDFKAANQNRIVNVSGSYEIDRLADRRPEFYSAIVTETGKAASGD
jgi:predicted amidohydrolase